MIAPLSVDAPLPPRILLADDNQDNVALIALYLERAPYRLETAENGRQAVERHMAAPFDLIFMDLEMPVQDGYDATRTIRQWERQQRKSPIPILALTAHAMDEHRERCRQAGFTDFLVKPVRKAAILAALDRYLGRAVAPGDRPAPATPRPAAQPDRERLRPLLPLFFTTCEETLDAANRALALGELETARGQGHKLKGAARSFGFTEIGQAGEALELAAGDGDAKAALASLLLARELVAQARRELFD
jgi:CheY-like chemotaxis protein/HPt (histidine-containing phosphotransfer) domain-containing protein